MSNFAKLINRIREYERLAPEHIKRVHKLQNQYSFLKRQQERNEKDCRRAREWLSNTPFSERGYGIPGCLEESSSISSSLERVKRDLDKAAIESENICKCSVCETTRRTGFYQEEPCKNNS